MKSDSAQASTPSIKRTNRSRQILVGIAVAEDHSDEDITDNHDWEWLYETVSNQNISEDQSVGPELHQNGTKGFGMGTEDANTSRQTRKSPKHGIQRIIGARKVKYEFKIGDCVLLKADETSEPWVGVILRFLEDEDGEKAAEFLWFSSQRDIPSKRKKRMDFLPNERYITPFSDINCLQSIDGKATIVSEAAFQIIYPGGKVPRGSKAFGTTFICRRGCNTKTITYTEEFIWEDIPRETENDVQELARKVDAETRTRAQTTSFANIMHNLELVDSEVAEREIQQPPKRQRISAIHTPRKVQNRVNDLTPSFRKISIKKPLEFTPLKTRSLGPDQVLSSPFQSARSTLHVSSVPLTLPCREEQFSTVYSHLETAIIDGSGVIYISGTPGTGKTATVREVVAQLNASVLADELDDFVFVEINGMKVTDPHQSYSLLWEALKGDRVSPCHALDLLEREFNVPSPRRVPCVVLMDELDQLVTKNQSVMYNFFNWPSLKHSKLIVLAVANTMDLPERTLSNKISSRLGLTRITFPGYTHEQLMKIIQSRLRSVSDDIVDADAIQFASRKVAAVSGDARRALDICRRAVEIAEFESAAVEVDLVSQNQNRKYDCHSRLSGRVTIATIKRAINEATTSPLQQHLRELPLSSKLLLAALIAKTRRTGIGESTLGEVLDEASRMAAMDVGGNILQSFLRSKSLCSNGFQSQTKKPEKASRAISLGFAVAGLVDAGIVGVDTRRADRTGNIRLCVAEDDVRLALRSEPDLKNLGF